MLHALDRVLEEPAVQRADLIVVTGDHTWGPQPAEVLDRLVALGERAVLVRGNADRELLQMSRGLDIGLNDDPVSVWGAKQLGAAHQELLDGMPESVTLEVEGFGPVFFSHATPRSDEEIVLVDSRIARWVDVFADLPERVQTVVSGHTHMPFMRLVDRRLVINPGSIGLPYGRAGAHWAVLDHGLASLGRTLIDRDELITETAARSQLPNARTWLEETVRQPESDFVALGGFGPRDGRGEATNTP